MEDIERIIPYDNFVSIAHKYIKPTEKYVEDVDEIKKLLKLIKDSKPMVFNNLLKNDVSQQNQEDFAIFSPVNMDFETVFEMNSLIIKILSKMMDDMKEQIKNFELSENKDDPAYFHPPF